MEELLGLVVSHPFTTVKVFLSFWGAIGTLIFLWGFIGFFLSHGHAEHQDHARVSMVWGTMLVGSAFLIWEAIRWLGGFF